MKKFDEMSNKAQDYYIKLNYYINHIKEMWFWERFLKRKEYLNRLDDLIFVLEEVVEFNEIEKDENLSNLIACAKKIR